MPLCTLEDHHWRMRGLLGWISQSCSSCTATPAIISRAIPLTISLLQVNADVRLKVALASLRFTCSLHEGGHRQSFGHAEVYVTKDGFLGNSNPRGTGYVASSLPDGAKSYTDETDVMACCRGDWSVYARLKVRPRKQR
jgi:hypothetical protein